MTAPIEDVSELPGKKLSDQEKEPIGEIKDIFATEDGFPMWVSVEVDQGMNKKRIAVVPLARIKDEDGELLVPYSKNNIVGSPEIDDSEGISEECDFTLRGYYGIGTGDQEMWSDNRGYATMVAEESSSTEKVENADDVETPDPDKRTDESRQRLEDPGSSEMRKVSAEDVAEGNDEQMGGGGDGDDDKDESKEDDESKDDEGKAESKEDDEGKTESKEDDDQPEGEQDEDQQPQNKEGGDEQSEGEQDQDEQRQGDEGQDDQRQGTEDDDGEQQSKGKSDEDEGDH